MALSPAIFTAMQAAHNQVCFTQTPHSTTIKAITGISDCGGEYPGGGPINLFAGETFSGTGWIDNGDGSYSYPTASGSASVLAVGTAGLLTLGVTYRFIYNLDAVSAGAVRPIAANTTGAYTSTPADDITQDLIAGSNTTNTGFQANISLAGATISNLRCYEL